MADDYQNPRVPSRSWDYCDQQWHHTQNRLLWAPGRLSVPGGFRDGKRKWHPTYLHRCQQWSPHRPGRRNQTHVPRRLAGPSRSIQGLEWIQGRGSLIIKMVFACRMCVNHNVCLLICRALSIYTSHLKTIRRFPLWTRCIVSMWRTRGNLGELRLPYNMSHCYKY